MSDDMVTVISEWTWVKDTDDNSAVYSLDVLLPSGERQTIYTEIMDNPFCSVRLNGRR